MAQPSGSKDMANTAALARDRARSQVRRATAAIGVFATAGAVGLGLLVASDTSAQSATTTPTVVVTTPTTTTTAPTSEGDATSGSTTEPTAPATTTTTPATTTTRPTTVSGQS
jgi:hypothetical protein